MLCLFSVLLSDSIVKIDDYPPLLLEEYKYAVKKKTLINVINEELNQSESDDESDKSDEGYDCILMFLQIV